MASAAAVLTWALALLSRESSTLTSPWRCGWTVLPGGVGGLKGSSTLREETQPLFTPLFTVLSATEARKGFWDYFSQSSGDKGKVEQQQKLAREPP